MKKIDKKNQKKAIKSIGDLKGLLTDVIVDGDINEPVFKGFDLDNKDKASGRK